MRSSGSLFTHDFSLNFGNVARMTFDEAIAAVPEGHQLVLQGAGEQWRARIIPPGYVNRWSPNQPIDAEGQTPEDAIRGAVEKCA